MVVSEYLRPKNLEEAYKLMIESKKNYLVAGGAWLKLSLKSAEKLISLDGLELDKIQVNKEYIEIGSMVTLRTVEINNEIENLYGGILSKAISKIMGVNIRNLATLGGSIMGKFAFSDIFPALLALNTKLIFYKRGEICLEDFLANPKMEKDILLKVKIKNQTGQGFFKKVAITPLDFSILSIAVSKNVEGFRISVGSTPYIASLAENAMDYINNLSKITDDNILTCSGMVIEELKFSKNNRSSKEYREELAKVYVKRGLKKVIANES
ncbi:FAD binding domain-containing protein [Mycoplasmatota bacterium WC30]